MIFKKFRYIHFPEHSKYFLTPDVDFGEVTKCNNCFDNYNNYINFCEQNFLSKNFLLHFCFFAILTQYLTNLCLKKL